MGRVILCAGRRAAVPYLVRGTGIHVATIEELCFALKFNLDMLENSSMERDLAVFIRDELGLKERGELLEQLVMSGASMKDRLVAIMCSCDLYSEEEIREICREAEVISNMSIGERRKRRADRYMKEGNTGDAAEVYRSILSSNEVNELTNEERGDLEHNLGVIEINHGNVEDAITLFRDAYNDNQSEQSLKAYLLALKISKPARYRSEVQRLVNNVELFNEIENEVNRAGEEFEQSTDFTEISRLKVLWQQGQHAEAKRLSAEMISDMKRAYRQEAQRA